MIRVLSSNAGGMGLIPGWELRPYMPQGQKPKTSNGSNIVTNSTKTLKMVHPYQNVFFKKRWFYLIFSLEVKWNLISCVQLFATHSMSMVFSRPEYWSGWPFPFPGNLSNSGLPHCRQILYQLSHQGSPRTLERVAYPSPADLPHTGIELGSPALQADSLSTELSGKP